MLSSSTMNRLPGTGVLLEGHDSSQEPQTDLPQVPATNTSRQSDPNPLLVDANVVHQNHHSILPSMGETKRMEDTNTNLTLQKTITDNIQDPVSFEREQRISIALPGTNALVEPPAESPNSPSPHSPEEKVHHSESEVDSMSSPPKKRKRKLSKPRTSWEERIRQLQEYKEKHGDLLIPIRFKENPSLGKFVHNTREQYKVFHRAPAPGKSKRCSLTVERIQELEALGFLWSAERSKHQKEDFEARLQQLKEYKKKYGDCLVPHGYHEDPSLGEWVHRQRTTYAHITKEDHLNPKVVERVKQLEALDFHFTVHADKWMEHWHELKEYKEIHGHCDIPTNCPENPKLGRWVHTQRHQRRLQLKGKKKSSMCEERVALLDSLGFSWESRPHRFEHCTTTEWQRHFDELVQFFDNCHHFCVPSDSMPELHAWCVEQKKRLQQVYQQQQHPEGQQLALFDSKTMPVEEGEALNAIGFTKDVYLGPEQYPIEESGDIATRSSYEEHLDHNELPTGYGEALDAMFAVYDHSEDHAKEDSPLDNGGEVSTLKSPDMPGPDCTLQASGTETDIHASGMATMV